MTPKTPPKAINQVTEHVLGLSDEEKMEILRLFLVQSRLRDESLYELRLGDRVFFAEANAKNGYTLRRSDEPAARLPQTRTTT